MNSNDTSEAEKPVPRAERVTHYPNEDHWAIRLNNSGGSLIVEESRLHNIVPESDRTFWGVLIREAKLRGELELERQTVSQQQGMLEKARVEMGTLIDQRDTARRNEESAWTNRNHFCHEIGIIGREIVGPRINAFKGDAVSPEAVTRETRKLIEMLEGQLRDVFSNGNRVAAALGLPEGAGVDEVLARITEIKELSEARFQQISRLQDSYVKWAKMCEQIAELLKVDPSLDGVVVASRKQHADYQEALQQLSNLGQFIGHPGATPAHVVSETVSLIGRVPLTALRIICRALEIDEEAPVSRIIEEIDRQHKEHDSWQRRALAAEAQLAGGPEDDNPYMAPEVKAELRREAVSRVKFGDGEEKTANLDGWTQKVAEQVTEIKRLTVERDGWAEKVAELTTENKGLTRFIRVVRRMHGIPQSTENSEALATIAEFLDHTEGWKKAYLQWAGNLDAPPL